MKRYQLAYKYRMNVIDQKPKSFLIFSTFLSSLTQVLLFM